MAHSIRLRGPWEYSIAGSDVAGRIEFPCRWSDLTYPAGRLTLVRRFGLPTGLEPGDRVLLRLRHSGSRIAARLNTSGLPLTTEPDGIHQSDITGLLSQRNELVVELTPPSPAPSDSTATVLKATLEIHSA